MAPPIEARDVEVAMAAMRVIKSIAHRVATNEAEPAVVRPALELIMASERFAAALRDNGYVPEPHVKHA